MNIEGLLIAIALALLSFTGVYVAFNWDKVMEIYNRGRGK